VARFALRLLLQEFDVPPGETVSGGPCATSRSTTLGLSWARQIHNNGGPRGPRGPGSRNGSKINGGSPPEKAYPAQRRRSHSARQPEDPLLPRGPAEAPRSADRQPPQLPQLSTPPTSAEARAAALRSQCGHRGDAERGDARGAPAQGGSSTVRGWSLQMQVELLERRSRSAAARRRPVLKHHLAPPSTSASPRPSDRAAQLDRSSRAALGLSANRATSSGSPGARHAPYGSERLPNPQLVTQLGQLSRRSSRRDVGAIEEFVDVSEGASGPARGSGHARARQPLVTARRGRSSSCPRRARG